MRSIMIGLAVFGTLVAGGMRAEGKRRLTTAVCGAAPALAVGYFVQRQGSNSSIRWTG